MPKNFNVLLVTLVILVGVLIGCGEDNSATDQGELSFEERKSSTIEFFKRSAFDLSNHELHPAFHFSKWIGTVREMHETDIPLLLYGGVVLDYQGAFVGWLDTDTLMVEITIVDTTSGETLADLHWVRGEENESLLSYTPPNQGLSHFLILGLGEDALKEIKKSEEIMSKIVIDKTEFSQVTNPITGQP